MIQSMVELTGIEPVASSFANKTSPPQASDLMASASLAPLLRQFDNYHSTKRTVAHRGARNKRPRGKREYFSTGYGTKRRKFGWKGQLQAERGRCLIPRAGSAVRGGPVTDTGFFGQQALPDTLLLLSE